MRELALAAMAARTEPAERRRADAERNIAAILDAAVQLLGERPDASMAEIAAAAGVARQTVYAHYQSREALLAAVAERAMATTLAAIDAAELRRGSAGDALQRLTRSWWSSIEPMARVLGALTSAFPAREEMHQFHSPIIERIESLVRRGQRSGEFDAALPVQWVAVSFLTLMHGAADQVAAGRMDVEQAESALRRTVPRVFGLNTD
jgi:AcrR family transcriptional regulator